jgi:hypothetical protein
MLVKVENAQITQVGLPEFGTLNDGRSVSQYDLLDVDTLKNEGWLPLEMDVPEYDMATENIQFDRYEIQADKVVSKHIVTVKPDNSPTLDDVKKSKIAKITLACSDQINSQFNSSASGSAHIYGYNKDDQQNFIKQAMLFQINPSIPSIYWSSKDGLVQLTKEQFFGLMMDAATHENSVWAKYFPLKAQIDSATTIEQLEVILWV